MIAVKKLTGQVDYMTTVKDFMTEINQINEVIDAVDAYKDNIMDIMDNELCDHICELLGRYKVIIEDMTVLK